MDNLEVTKKNGEILEMVVSLSAKMNKNRSSTVLYNQLIERASGVSYSQEYKDFFYRLISYHNEFEKELQKELQILFNKFHHYSV